MAANNEVSTSHSVPVNDCIVHAVSEMGDEDGRTVPMKYSDHNPVTFRLTLGNKSCLVMSWNIEQSNARKDAPALYIKGLEEEKKPHIILTQEDRCGENEYNARCPDSKQRDFGSMLKEDYNKIYSNGHKACVSNGAYLHKECDLQIKLVMSCTNARPWTEEELKALNNKHVQSGDLTERSVDFLELSTDQSSCTIANVHLDGGRYAEQQMSVDWKKAYLFKVLSLASVASFKPNIVVGDFNCVYGSLESQEKYLADKIKSSQKLPTALKNVLEEFEGTHIADVKEFNANNAATIFNKGPIGRLMDAGYTIVPPKDHPHVHSSLLGKTLVDLVFVLSEGLAKEDAAKDASYTSPLTVLPLAKEGAATASYSLASCKGCIIT